MKLIAYDITNLTDARYFAARGACMIGFSTELSSVEEVNAIKDWVDVPAFFLRLPAQASAEYIWEWQERTGITSFLISDLSEDTMVLFPQASWIMFFDGEEDDIELSHLFIPTNHVESWAKSNESDQEIDVYVDFLALQQDILFEDDRVTGVLIKGTSEDKVGVKSFDLIDDFLDEIDIEY